jgi:hypothetical protein
MQPLPSRTQRHLRDCPVCREYYAVERDLTLRLIGEAKAQGHPLPPFLHARIMASLDHPPQTATARPKFLLRPIWATAFLIIGLGLLGLPFLRDSLVRRSAIDQRPAERVSLTRPVAGQLSAAIGQDAMEWGKTLHQPLETEMQSVVTDAKTALQVLASNFLPER